MVETELLWGDLVDGGFEIDEGGVEGATDGDDDGEGGDVGLVGGLITDRVPEGG